MEIFIGSEKACDQRATQEFINQIKKKPDSVLGLATGSTPETIYKELINKHKSGDISFAKVKTFNLDEYVAIPKEHKCSYYYYMNNNLFKHIDIKPESVNLPDGNARDLIKECWDYDQKIKKSGGIDLQILGIGHNGHIAFNEPGTLFDSTTHLVDLADSTIQANSRFFDSHDQVPSQAITMGIRTIMQARKIMLVAKGESKADIIYDSLYGPITTQVPTSVLQLHPNLLVILDEKAASRLMP